MVKNFMFTCDRCHREFIYELLFEKGDQKDWVNIVKSIRFNYGIHFAIGNNSFQVCSKCYNEILSFSKGPEVVEYDNVKILPGSDGFHPSAAAL